MTIRTTGPIFGLLNRRTTDHSDQWTTFRTNDPSDYWTVGLLTIRINARFSDQWPVGPTTIRNIEPSPNIPLLWSLHTSSRNPIKISILQSCATQVGILQEKEMNWANIFSKSSGNLVYRRTNGRTDGQTDGQTSGWIQYTPIPPSVERGV